MWSASPITGFARFLAYRAGITDKEIEKWLVAQKYEQVFQTLNMLRFVGNSFGHFSHAIVDVQLFSEWPGGATQVLEARKIALWQALNPYEKLRTIEQDLKTEKAATEHAQNLTGELKVDPTFWYKDPEPGAKLAQDELSGGGIFDDLSRQGFVDLAFGTGASNDPSSPLQEPPAAEWKESLDKLIVESMTKHMTPQTMLTLGDKYREALNKVIHDLTPEQQTQPLAIELAVQTSASLRVFVEAELSRICDLVAPEVAEKLIAEQNIDLAVVPEARVMLSVAGRFEVEVHDHFFSPDGLVENWNTRAVFEHITSPTMEQQMNIQRETLALAVQARAKHLADFNSIHVQEAVEKDKKLQEEKSRLEKNRDTAKEAHAAAEANRHSVEISKKEKTKNVEEAEKKNKKLYQKWAK